MIYLNLRFDDPSPLRIVRWKKAYLLPSNQRGFPLAVAEIHALSRKALV